MVRLERVEFQNAHQFLAEPLSFLVQIVFQGEPKKNSLSDSVKLILFVCQIKSHYLQIDED